MNSYKNLRLLLNQYNLVLASRSPRRVRMLTQIGVAFRQIPADIDEREDLHPEPFRLAEILSRLKAEAVLPRVDDGEIIMGCDTIVVLDNEIIGKPDSPDRAVEMLLRLSGRKHTVCSAITLFAGGEDAVSGHELTDVYFRTPPREALERYAATGEPLDKAGAYGIQGKGGFLVDRINGNLDNVIGLPLDLLDELAGRYAKNKGLYD